MKEITVQELKAKMDAKEDFQFIDVREPHEVEIAEIGAELMPMGEILSQVDKISRDKMVVIHCRSGARSGTIVQALEAQHGFKNLYNLKGGILAWSREIDSNVPQY
jgi:sulfur-carrier protein adenylyltransferase/sulfurtransferase